MRADVLDYVGFFFDFQNSFIPNYLAQRNPCIPFRLFQGYTPADCFMLRAHSLTLDSALPKIWLRFTIFAKLFHFVQFLTIRQSGFLNGQCPGERTDRAGLCKAHKARLCELGANPRRLPRPEDLKYIINIFV